MFLFSHVCLSNLLHLSLLLTQRTGTTKDICRALHMFSITLLKLSVRNQPEVVVWREVLVPLKLCGYHHLNSLWFESQSEHVLLIPTVQTHARQVDDTERIIWCIMVP